MRLLTLFVGSWMLGLAMYWLVGSIHDGRLMGSGDLSAAALYSGVMFALTAPVIYLPAKWWIRRRTSIRRAAVIMSAVTVVHTVTATALVFAAFGGVRLRSLVTPEAVLFYVIFGTAGAAIWVAIGRT